MAPDLSGLNRKATFALAALAALATEVAAGERFPWWQSAALASGWIGVTAVAAYFLPRPRAGERVPGRLVSCLLLSWTCPPFAIEPVRRALGEGYPLEFQMVFALRNLGLGLAACASWLLCMRLAAIVSLFLTLFAVSMTDHPAVVVVLGVYSAAGCVWLMLVYWSGLRGWFAVREAAFVEVRSERWRFPWPALLVAGCVVGVTLSLLAIGPVRRARVLAEWLPTSGGTGAYDPYARGGVNDGDDEVKGKNARSTGLTLSDVFLDSPLASLYDMVTDMYGEPFKVKDRERALALQAEVAKNESEKAPADNLRPNKEFPLPRQTPRTPRESTDRAARALFEVAGRTPLHVRAATFDRFDGWSWQARVVNPNLCLIDQEPDSCWMQVRAAPRSSFFAGPDSHQFKITGNLGNLLPTPPHLNRFRVGKVNDTSFFAWGPENILCMAPRTTPTGIVVETECRTVDPRALAGLEFSRDWLGAHPNFLDRSRPLDPEVQALAERWTADLPTGWQQIDAVTQHLRAEYALDWSAQVPEGCHDPLAQFLLRDRRGPDFQFATAAAVLLRSLGYPTRLANGFYASPAHYDRQTHHTPVVKEDLHFWAEVLLPTGDWLILEPTPGYELPAPVLPWTERLVAVCLALAVWAQHQWLGLSLATIACVVLWRRRLELTDRALLLIYRFGPMRSWQHRVAAVLELLERRGRWTGRPRNAGQTYATWLHSFGPEVKDAKPDLVQMAQLADWAAYGADLGPPWTETDICSTCRRVLDSWTLPRWRQMALIQMSCDKHKCAGASLHSAPATQETGPIQ